jgi:hypothetical protein
LLRVATVGFVPRKTSGRNTGGQIAETLNTTGIYSLTRNPLYLANCMTYVGIVLSAQDLLLAIALVLFLVLYYERIIMAEEAFLVQRFGQAYLDWAAEVPPFLPRLHGWKRPELPFSIRSVLRREPPSWLAAVLCLAVIELAADAFGREHEELTGDGWLSAMAVTLVIYVALLALNRWTKLLRAPGR